MFYWQYLGAESVASVLVFSPSLPILLWYSVHKRLEVHIRSQRTWSDELHLSLARLLQLGDGCGSQFRREDAAHPRVLVSFLVTTL